jgi:hypothetical protein
MAKQKMMCPFSGKPCKECPIYRGRHYYLCFAEKYRGHMDEAGKVRPAIKRSRFDGKDLPLFRRVGPFRDNDGSEG